MKLEEYQIAEKKPNKVLKHRVAFEKLDEQYPPYTSLQIFLEYLNVLTGVASLPSRLFVEAFKSPKRARVTSIALIAASLAGVSGYLIPEITNPEVPVLQVYKPVKKIEIQVGPTPLPTSTPNQTIIFQAGIDATSQAVIPVYLNSKYER